MGFTQKKTTSTGVLLFFKILYWDMRVHNFLSDVHYFLHTLLAFISTKWKTWTHMKSLNTDQPLKYQHYFPIHENPIIDDQPLCFGELKMVMDSLGISYDPISSADHHRFGVREFSAMFDEDEPSFEELKEAFGVFDVNQDGFIDATELQRVLCSLGLMERSHSQVVECTRMMSAFDENGDGLIDFNEFVKLMEKFR